MQQPKPLARHQVIESDQFCPCSYNLHGQRVERDERLEFEVVRCPECGRWHPAGLGSTAMRPWLGRLAVLLLAVWALVLIGSAAAVMGTILGFHFSLPMMDAVYVTIETSSGRPVGWNYGADAGTTAYIYLDTKEVASGTGIMNTAVPSGHPLAQFEEHHFWRQETWEYVVVWSIPLLIAFIAGIVQTVVLWHLPRLSQFIVPIALTALPYGVMVLIAFTNDDFTYMRPTMLTQGAILFGATLTSWSLGILIGRPIGRGLTRLLIPPRPRQVLAFLWHADGKTMPGMTGAK